MEIGRDKLRQELEVFCFADHGLVIGLPGVGKTYLLQKLEKDFRSKGTLCLYLPIDKLGAETESGLKADIEAIAGINIDGNLLSYLKRLHGSRNTPSVLILDAFDAARSESARTLYLSLVSRVIQQLGESWRVIVSVRNYDAKKSQKLQELFPKHQDEVPDEQLQLNGVACRHLLIPLLTHDEVRDALRSMPRLLALHENGSVEFREILRTPFNLWLAERIADVPDLGAVSSQVQLLGFFWRHRVAEGPNGVGREALLTKIARAMSNQHTLSVKTEDVYEASAGNLWNELFSAAVLSEETKSARRIGFSHALLFDYAVSVLLIEDDADRFISFILEDPARSLFLQPSIRYYFARLWLDRRDVFWDVFRAALGSDVTNLRLLGRLIPASVISTELRQPDDLAPLYQALMEQENLGEESILRLLQALRAEGIEREGIWSEVLRTLSEQMRRRFAWDVALVLSVLIERAELTQNKAVLNNCGHASRNMLAWVWKERGLGRDTWVDSLGGRLVVPLVARTFGTDPGASRSLLEPVLAITNEPDFPIDYIYRLSDSAKRVWPHDPELVAKVYLTVFGHNETSDKQTNFGTPTLPMSSTRRQDYEHCRFILIEAYPNFLRASPKVAASVAIDCLDSFIMQEHVNGHLKKGVKAGDLIQVFTFLGKKAHFFSDNSYIWDEGTFQKEPIRLADHLCDFLGKSAEKERVEEIDCLLEVFRDHAHMAFFWRRLLRVGAKHPKIFAHRLFELCLARPIQLGAETIRELGVFIEAAAPDLDDVELGRIEDSILGMTQGSKRRVLIEERNRLLARLPFNRLQTEHGRRIIAALRKANRVPKNDPLVSFRSWSEPYTEEKWLKKQGVDPNKPENLSLRDLYGAMEKAIAPLQDAKPDMGTIRKIFPSVKQLFDHLKVSQQADKEVVTQGWTTLGSAAKVLCRGLDDPKAEEFDLCKRVALICSKHEYPIPNPEHDATYKSAGWSPSPRTEAAQALPWIGLRDPSAEVLEAIDRLVHDPVPEVRFLVTHELFRISKVARESFWGLIEHLANQENNVVVQQALLATIGKVVATEELLAIQVLGKLHERVLKTSPPSDILESFCDIVMWLLLVRENPWARQLSDSWLSRPNEDHAALRHAAFDALRRLEPGALRSQEQAASFGRALHWLGEAIEASGKEMARLSRQERGQTLSEERQVTFRDLYAVSDETVTRLRFAIEDRKKTPNGDEAPVSDEEYKEFYFRIKPLLEQVLALASDQKNGFLLAPTAHHFMELLAAALVFDLDGVVHMAAGVARASSPLGYNLDKLAVEEVVKLVERVLADYRTEMRQRENILQDILALLDIFADAGWPEALKLIWRMDEVFRQS